MATTEFIETIKFFSKLSGRNSLNPTLLIFDIVSYHRNKKMLSEKFFVSISKDKNLFLITNPLINEEKECEIEDLFDNATHNHVINGRKFSRKDEDMSKFYNKDIFSKYITTHYT